MNMTPIERAEQEAKEIAEKWFNAYRVITSDFEKRELKAAITSALLLKYGLESPSGESVLPLFLFGDPIKWFRDTFGDDLTEFCQVESGRIESVIIGGFRDREEYDEAVAHMSPSEREVFQ